MATITYAHAGDHAVVTFSGELDWEASRELVEVVDGLVHEYFYCLIELVVTSPGGNVRAFEFVLHRHAKWRRQGVTLRTRILSEAASAAAVLIALGDERIAEPGATLAFHGARVAPDGGISAQGSATLSPLLRDLDETFIARLADRALGAAREVRHDAAAADLGLLQLLWREFGRPSKPGARAPRKVRKLARAVGRYVDRAVKRRDRDALRCLYRWLLAHECTVSAPLAVSLRLIDRIGAGPVPESRGSSAAGLGIPEWRVLYPPDGRVPREVLCRHVLATGETGSGKTASAILPVAAAMARAPLGTLASALIIDPKRELARTLRMLAPERVHEVHVDRLVLNVMAGPRWSLDEDLAARRWVSAARRSLCRLASFVPANPARVLLRHQAPDSSSNKEFFDREGTSLGVAVLAFVLMLIDPRTPEPGDWLGDSDDVEAYVWVEELRKRARGEGGPNLFSLAAWCLESGLLSVPESRRSVVAYSNGEPPPPGSEWIFGRLARVALERLCGESPEGRDLCGRILGYWGAVAPVTNQFVGTRATAATVFQDFASVVVGSTLYVGCEPGYRAACGDGDGLDFGRLVAPAGPGTLVVFQPARDDQDRLVAVALKALFFEAVLDDPDRGCGGADLPLVGYVADEFHRFVTSDSMHGEQSFLDTCRSFGAFCLLACQSVASIEHALAHGGGTDTQNRASVEILLSNTATKFVFRSTHPSMARRVMELGPRRPGRPGVTEVRPVSSLGVGEAYVALSDGRFERRQLEPFVAPDLARAGAGFEA